MEPSPTMSAYNARRHFDLPDIGGYPDYPNVGYGSDLIFANVVHRAELPDVIAEKARRLVALMAQHRRVIVPVKVSKTLCFQALEYRKF